MAAADPQFLSVNSLEPDPDRALRVAREHSVLRGLVGSEVHGLSNPGTDDRDEMGVCVEPREYVLGLRRFEHCVARTQPEGSPSGPGDLDLTIYGLRKFCRLALKGSPTVLLLLFVEGDHVLERDAVGAELQALAPALLSRRTGAAFLGYLGSQLNGLRGGVARASRTRELSAPGDAPGTYDTKYAMHALRIGHQGLELLQTGRIALPVREPARSWLRAVRAGEPSRDEVIAAIAEVEARLAAVVDAATCRRRAIWPASTRSSPTPTRRPGRGSRRTFRAVPGGIEAFPRRRVVKSIGRCSRSRRSRPTR